MILKNKVYKIKNSTLLVSIIEDKVYATSLINGHQTELSDEMITNLDGKLEEIPDSEIHESWKAWLFL